MPPERLEALEKALRTELARREARRQLARWLPHPKQAEFHALGAVARERLLMAANRFGKTQTGAAETAMHLTGRYPDWWTGKRFDKPVRAWAAGVTNESTRDIVQAKLIGPPERREDWGTGFLPADSFDPGDVSMSRGVADAIDTIPVKHASGGWSRLQFKSYERGREKWQGTALEVVWLDEEPPEDIYFEALTRTNETGGVVYLTFTPLLGMSNVVMRFIEAAPSAGLGVVQATIDDALHIEAEMRAKIIASYPPHELEARTKGVPSLGSGVIFPVTDDSLLIDPFPIPAHYKLIAGVDFGYDHPFAAVLLAWDSETDIIYVIREYRVSQATPIIHAATLREWSMTQAGSWPLPIAWPHDGLQHDKGSGEQLAEQYRKQGLKMLPERATFADGTNGVEAGLLEMLSRMQTGKWKVFRTCPLWMEEKRLYHREDGKVVKIKDDVLSASRYAMMMRRHARPPAMNRVRQTSTASHAWPDIA